MNWLKLSEIVVIPKFAELGMKEQTLKQANSSRLLGNAVRKNYMVGVGVGYMLEVDIEHQDFAKWLAYYKTIPIVKGKMKKLAESQEKKAS